MARTFRLDNGRDVIGVVKPRELLRRGVEIVDAADAEDAAGRDALVLRFVDGPEGRVSLPPPLSPPLLPSKQ